MCLVDTGHTATPVMLILGICIVFGRVLSMLRIPQTLATFVTSNIESKIAVLLAINLFLLVAGMLMDTIPCILILAPIFLPIVQAYNVDIVHFGILMTCNLAIGFVTPPIGTNLFVAAVSYQDPHYAHCKARSAVPGHVPRCTFGDHVRAERLPLVAERPVQIAGFHP